MTTKAATTSTAQPMAMAKRCQHCETRQKFVTLRKGMGEPHTLLPQSQRRHLGRDEESHGIDRTAAEEDEQLDGGHHGVELGIAGRLGHAHAGEKVQEDALHDAAEDDDEAAAELVDDDHGGEHGDEGDDRLDDGVDEGLGLAAEEDVQCRGIGGDELVACPLVCDEG